MTHLPSTLSPGKEQYLTAGGYLNEETNNRNASAISQDSSTGFCRPGTACQRETNWETLLCTPVASFRPRCTIPQRGLRCLKLVEHPFKKGVGNEEISVACPLAPALQ